MPTRHFRDEILQIPDLTDRARRICEIEKEMDAEIRQIKLRLARDMKDRGMTMSQIGAAFDVTRARAHQMVHQRASGKTPTKVAV